MSEDDAMSDEALQGSLPVLADERVYSLFDLVGLQTVFGFGAWAFLTGSLTGLTVSAYDSLATALLGNTLGLYPGALFAIIFARYGVDQYMMGDSPWGHKGSKAQVFLFFVPVNLGFMAYCSYLMGQSFRRLVPIIWSGAPEFLTVQWPGATIFAAGAILIGVFVAYQGPVWLQWFQRLTVPLLLVITFWFIFVIVTEVGIGTLFSMAPPEGGLYDTYRMNWMNALEVNVALGFAWAYYWGGWTRLAKTENAAHHGPWWGWGPILCVPVIFSAFAALITGIYEPTAWFSEFAEIMGIAPNLVTALALLLFGIGNTGAVAMLNYTMAISEKVVKPNFKWKHATITVGLLAILLANPVVFEQYSTLLTLAACVWAAYSAIMLTDFLMRRKYGFFDVKHIRDMYENGAIFNYHNGFNVAAWIVQIGMIPLYLGIYNPITGTVGFFGFGFPTIPGLMTIFVLSAISYPILFRIIYPDHFEKAYETTKEEDQSAAAVMEGGVD